LVAELGRTALRSTTPVQADGPAGQITADAMELEPVATGGDSYLLVFNGHVKLVYQPAE
jgi:lipopolysaccharide export system protein LptC